MKSLNLRLLEIYRRHLVSGAFLRRARSLQTISFICRVLGNLREIFNAISIVTGNHIAREIYDIDTREDQLSFRECNSQLYSVTSNIL